jgi:hypothetical protein
MFRIVAAALAVSLLPCYASAQERRVRNGGVTVNDGASAMQFVEQVARKNPMFRMAEAGAAQRLRAKGLRPRPELTTVYRYHRRTTPTPTLLDQFSHWFMPRLAAKQEYGEGEGYVVYSSWDDGDDATWEGNIFVQANDPSGTWYTLNTQVDVTADWLPVRWVDGGRGGDRDRGEREYRTRDGGLELVNLRGVSLLSAMQAGTGCGCLSRAWSGKAAGCIFQTSLLEAGGQCLAAAGLCRWAGPGYFGCVGRGCALVLGGRLWNNAIAWKNNCDSGIE